jgi:hypothetical protein
MATPHYAQADGSSDYAYKFYFRNFLCIHSFPKPKDIIVTSGLLAFVFVIGGESAHHTNPQTGGPGFSVRVISLSLWCPHTTLARQQDLQP